MPAKRSEGSRRGELDKSQGDQAPARLTIQPIIRKLVLPLALLLRRRSTSYSKLGLEPGNLLVFRRLDLVLLPRRIDHLLPLLLRQKPLQRCLLRP